MEAYPFSPTVTARCSIDPDPGRDPPPNPNGRPSLGASSPAGHGNPVAHTHTDSWHTASTIDDQPYTVRGAPAAPQRRRVMNRRLERRLDLVPQKCAKSVCLSSISRISQLLACPRPQQRVRGRSTAGNPSDGNSLPATARRTPTSAATVHRGDENVVPSGRPVSDTAPGSTLILTGRIGVEISGFVGARGGRIGLPDSLSGGVSRRAGRGDSHSEIRRTWFGARFEATTWMVGDLVTTEAPPLAGLAARPRLLARLRSTRTLAYKLATTTDHKVIGIMYLVAFCMRGMTAADGSSCGRLAQVPDGSHSSVRPLHRMNRWGTWSWQCYQPTERSCSQVPGDE
jgi:hypothetical protein